MRTSQPPTKSNFPFQLHSFFWNFSSMQTQSLLVNFIWFIGIPRYISESGISKPIPKYACILLFIALGGAITKSSILWKLIFKPDNCSRVLSTSFSSLAYSKSWSLNKMVSYAYCRTDTTTPTNFSIGLSMENTASHYLIYPIAPYWWKYLHSQSLF